MTSLPYSASLLRSFALVAFACLFCSAAAALEVDTTATMASPSLSAAETQAVSGAAIPTSPRPVAPGFVNFNEERLLATWNGGSLTTTDVSATLALRRPESAQDIEPSVYNTTADSRWRSIVRDLAYELIIYQKALSEGITTATPEVRAPYEQARQEVINRAYFDVELSRRLPAARERLAREYYEANRDTLFTRPERIIVTSLQVPFFDPVTVAAGETLEGIARRISGSPEDRFRILRGESPYPPRLPQGRARAVVPELEAKEGERLLVPVGQDERERRRGVARDIRERLLLGDSVVTAALSVAHPRILVAVNGSTYIPDFDRLPPQAASAIQAMTSATQTVTDPIETDYGIDLYVLAARLTTQTQTFEEARERIAKAHDDNERVLQRLREELRAEVFNELRTTHSLEINMAALERDTYGGEDPLTGSTWIVRTKDFTLTLDEYLRELEATERVWSALTPGQRIEMAKAAPSVMRHMTQLETQRLDLDDLPEVLEAIRSREIQEVSKEWLRRQQQKDGQTTPGVIRDFYTRNLDRYTSRSMVTLREITRRFDPALPPAERAASLARAKEAIEKIREEVGNSKEAFEAAARRQSASLSTRSRGGLIGTVPVNFRGAAVEAELLKTRPGEVTAPVVVGSEVVILRIDDFVGGVVQPFEKVAEQVIRDFVAEVPSSRRKNRQDAMLKEAGFKLHF